MTANIIEQKADNKAERQQINIYIYIHGGILWQNRHRQ